MKNRGRGRGVGVPTGIYATLSLSSSYAPRGASISCGLSRLRILLVTTGVYPILFHFSRVALQLLVQAERAVVQAGSTPHLLEICDRDLRYFLREVVCGSQVAADKPHVARDILRELGFAGLVRKQAVHLNLSGAGNRGHLSLSLAAMLEPVHVAVQDHEVVGVGCSRVAVAVHVLELVRLLHLFDQVLVQRQLKFNGKLHFVGLHRQNLDRGRLNLCGRLVLRQCRASREEQHQGERQQGAQIADQLHCFFSFGFACASASPSTGTLVLAPWLSKAFLALSALPCGRVKIAPCMPPEGSRYSIESVSILLRNRLRNLPPPYGANIVSVPTVPPMARSVSLPVITSWIEAAGTTTFFFPFVNTRDPFSATSVPLTLCFKPSSPMTCFVSANDVPLPVFASWARQGAASELAPIETTVAANSIVYAQSIFIFDFSSSRGDRSLQLGHPACASYASPVRDTTNLPPIPLPLGDQVRRPRAGRNLSHSQLLKDHRPKFLDHVSPGNYRHLNSVSLKRLARGPLRIREIRIGQTFGAQGAEQAGDIYGLSAGVRGRNHHALQRVGDVLPETATREREIPGSWWSTEGSRNTPSTFVDAF